MSLAVYSVMVAGALIGYLLWRLLRKAWLKRRRAQLYASPFSADWPAVLEQHVALYSRLPAALRDKLHGHINYFLADKQLVGRNGQVVTDEIKLIIAANACLLIMNRNDAIFPGFKTILIYPDTYVAKQVSFEGDVKVSKNSVRAGESWHGGPVVLSLSDVMRGSLNGEDGHNVVLHEFAHKLDEENLTTNGMPILRNREQYANWIEVLSKEYEEFLSRVDRKKNKVIDEYGAVSPPEFFAVATESFFEKGPAMAERLPELYKELQDYYGVDPASW